VSDDQVLLALFRRILHDDTEYVSFNVSWLTIDGDLCPDTSRSRGVEAGTVGR
jgi:hypothetical protein